MRPFNPISLESTLAKVQERAAALNRNCACGAAFLAYEDRTECEECEQKRREAQRDEARRQAEAHRRANWEETLLRGGVPAAYVVPQTIALPPDLVAWRGEPWSVTFLGLVGSGKTWAATRLYGELLCIGAKGVWMDASEAVERIRREIATDHDGRTMDEMLKAGVLLLDDLLAEREDSEFAKDKLSFILRHRYNHKLATIVTSNSVERVGEQKGLPGLGGINHREPRVASRLGEGIVKKIKSNDRRLKP